MKGTLRRGQKTPESAWRLLRTHERLKGAILAQMKERKLTVGKLSDEVGIHRGCIDGYMRGAVSPSLTDYQMIQICNYLGIEVDLEITINGRS